MLFDNFIYVESQAFLFTYIPKAACTNWKCVIRGSLGYEDYLSAARAHDRSLSGLVFLCDLPSEQRDLLLESNDIKKFTFVRNPYSRALSAYLNKVEPYVQNGESHRDDPHWLSIYKEIKKFGLSNSAGGNVDVTFLRFLEWIKYSESTNTKNEHWLPQSDILGIDRVKYDFMGRFENIETDSAQLLKLMGARCAFPTQKEISFPGTRATQLLDTYLHDQEMQLIREIYVRDFADLGYSY